MIKLCLHCNLVLLLLKHNYDLSCCIDSFVLFYRIDGPNLNISSVLNMSNSELVGKWFAKQLQTHILFLLLTFRDEKKCYYCLNSKEKMIGLNA